MNLYYIWPIDPNFTPNQDFGDLKIEFTIGASCCGDLFLATMSPLFVCFLLFERFPGCVRRRLVLK